ncbi:hypothetical protein MSHOH_3893 [Methanosarcina horonobensis HB-1 = JCM 15518]|uniref:Archaeal Type IV pilin N-terminal domain-containing protein n=3 Tax=Methanosarcina horonobensis TaxID=418008 RepID=A0A0E3SGU6_9EURY|nr:hypothetical protein [Methanosarcina horonobensis]AKB80376.1 hypothetical protein MSHOH_3893 [Methanosarcina horonobensis HB-1 = JCM 15518]
MEKKGFKAIHTFCRSESGVSTAVAAALLIGIVVIFMTTVQINYMPVWKEDAEYAHMADVWHDMSRFKSNVDIITAGLEINPNARIVLNSPIQVGGSEVPFIRSTTTGGSLAINKDMSGMSVIVIDNESSELFNSEVGLYYTGTVFYRPSNLHYVDEMYCYENGALIVSQKGRSVMKLAPTIVMEKDPGSVNLLIRGVVLDSPRGIVLSSNTVEDIRLTSKESKALFNSTDYESFYNITSVNVTIYTENKEAWENYFRDSASDITLFEGTDYHLDNSSTYAVTFSLHPVGEDLYVTVYRSVIKIETGLL